MANQGPSYGFSREIQLKNQARFSLEEARDTLSWISTATGVPFQTDPTQMESQSEIAEALKDGVQLCLLASELEVGRLRFIKTPKLPFHKMENISTFLEAIKKYGVPEIDCFQTVDLYEQKQMWKVIECLRALASVAQKKGSSLPIPSWAVRMSKENRREFSEEVLKEGKTLVSLQYGSNKGASQAGMTAYGMQRQIIPEQQKVPPASPTATTNGQNGTNGHTQHDF